MNTNIPWSNEKAAKLILLLEGGIANLIFMLLKNKHINSINSEMDKIAQPKDDEKGEIIIQFHSLLKTRLLCSSEGKKYAKGYLEKTFDNTDFFDSLIKSYPVAEVDVYDLKAEMDILKDTVIKNMQNKSYFSNIDDLKVELSSLIVDNPVDAAMVLIFLLDYQK